jgi:multiple sugar transport system ATP-binding protein
LITQLLARIFHGRKSDANQVAIRKVPHSHGYHLTPKGRTVITALRVAPVRETALDTRVCLPDNFVVMARIELQDLSKVFEGPQRESIWALRQLCLAVADREFLVLVGPSGCGKSTALRLIAGLEEATQGSISIDGRVVTALPPKERDVAMVFQQHALYPHLTVYENLAFGLKLRRLPRADIQRRVTEAANILGLDGLLDRLPKALSGGQRQRVAVGRAIVRQPKVFLFDEPLSNLDAQMRVQMRMELGKLHRRLDATMIYVTHDQVEAMTLGDRIAVLRDGQIQQVADPVALYQKPANVFVASFIGSPPMNLLRGHLNTHGTKLAFDLADLTPAAVDGRRLSLPTDTPPALHNWVGRQIILGIRPEDMRLGRPDTRAPSWTSWHATVELAEPLGAETLVHLVTREQPFVVRSTGLDRFAADEPVWARVDVNRCHWFDPDSGQRVE